MNPCLVVISHYNAWEPGQLVALLDQIGTIPAGWPFRVRVVVNRAVDRDLELPERHRDVEVLYRENTGYNIGAWDHGWRQGPAYDTYLFLQEECRILQPGWLAPFVRLASNPRVGLVGESMTWGGLTWDRLHRYYHRDFLGPPIDGQVSILPDVIRVSMERRGISPGRTGVHLQSLVLAARRPVLEAVDGFLIGESYQQAVVAEVAASKKVEALGLRVREVGFGPFRYILHPQWAHLRGNKRRMIQRYVEPFLPTRLVVAVKERLAAAYLAANPAPPADPAQPETSPSPMGSN